MSEDIRVVRGVPTDEELAAIVGVLMLRPTVVPAQPEASVSVWVAMSRPAFAHADGRPTRPGAGAWRASALPRGRR